MRDNAGKFSSGNPGKPKGAKNKLQTDLRSTIAEFLDSNFDTFKEKLDKLKPAEYARVYTSLIEFSIPKMRQSDVKIDIDSMSDEQVERLVNEILSQAEQATDNG